jgi:hypothetical protein
MVIGGALLLGRKDAYAKSQFDRMPSILLDWRNDKISAELLLSAADVLAAGNSSVRQIIFQTQLLMAGISRA